jgi:hypothetical protein
LKESPQVTYRIARLILAAAVSLSSAAFAQGKAGNLYSKLPPPCAANALSLGLDAEDGNFDAASHSGILVVVRNIGPTACQIPRLPSIAFLDAAGKTLDISAELAPVRGMHPGPVMLPLAIAPNAEATSTLTWISGQVFDHGVCLSPFQITVTVGGATLHAPFSGVICGQSATTIGVTPTWFQLDPVWKPGS